MSVTRWLLTAVSFAVMFGASAWVVTENWPAGGMPMLAWSAHAAALAAVCVEATARALKIQSSAIAVGLPLRFGTAFRVCLGGDFAAAITPARSGAEPARFLVLGESGMAVAGRVLVLFLELFLEMCSLALVCLVLAWLFPAAGRACGDCWPSWAAIHRRTRRRRDRPAVGPTQCNGPPPAGPAALGMHAGRWRTVQRTLRQLRASVDSLRGVRARYMLAAFGFSVVHVVCKVAALPVLVYLGDRRLR